MQLWSKLCLTCMVIVLLVLTFKFCVVQAASVACAMPLATLLPRRTILKK